MSFLNSAMVEELKKAIDLQEYMRQFMELKRSGDHYSAKCPFHNDSTPSFHVWADHFHCYGCGKHGDVIEYEQHRTGLSFPDAVVSLADRFNFNVVVVDEQDKQAAALAVERKRYVAIVEAVADYYHQILFSDNGKEARKYLDSRGFGEAYCKAWKLGVAPGFSVLEELSRKNGWDLLDVEKAGLLGTSQDGNRKYDFFRNRIVIPIRNERGQTIGFGGRKYREEDAANSSVPKFINPRETAIYSKSRVLFNFDRARAAIVSSGDVIVVEGYMDALSLANAGVENVVAVSGTAMTPEHVKMLAKCARRVFLCFDADAAGQKAAGRAFEVAFPLNLVELLFLKVSDGKDPDEFVRKHGGAAFKLLLQSATPIVRQVTLWAKGGSGSSRESWIRAVRSQVLSVIQKNPDSAQKEVAMDLVAAELGLSSSALLVEKLPQSYAPSSGGVKQGALRQKEFASSAHESVLPPPPPEANSHVWLVQSSAEIKLVVALLCLSFSYDANGKKEFELCTNADSLMVECAQMGLVSKQTSEMVSYACSVLKQKCAEMAVYELPWGEFLEAPASLRFLVAMLKGDVGYIEELGMNSWLHTGGKKAVALADSGNALALSNAAYINFCIQDTQLSQKRGSLVVYLHQLLTDFQRKSYKIRLLGAKF
jgi:DNA primase catalytic core